MDSEQIPLFLFQLFLLFDKTDFIIRHLLQLFSAFLVRQFKVIYQLADLAGYLAKDILTITNGTVENTDSEKTPIINICIDRSWRYNVINGNAFTGLPVTINSTNPLFNLHRIPGKIIVDHTVAELIIQAFAAHLGKQHYIQRIFV